MGDCSVVYRICIGYYLFYDGPATSHRLDNNADRDSAHVVDTHEKN